MIFHHFLLMLTVFFSKFVSYPVSHSFPIEMRELWGLPVIKCASFPLDVNCDNASVNTVVDCIWLPHADETYIVRPCLCAFS